MPADIRSDWKKKSKYMSEEVAPGLTRADVERLAPQYKLGRAMMLLYMVGWGVSGSQNITILRAPMVTLVRAIPPPSCCLCCHHCVRCDTHSP